MRKIALSSKLRSFD